jgi:hypothetical protein
MVLPRTQKKGKGRRGGISEEQENGSKMEARVMKEKSGNVERGEMREEKAANKVRNKI